MAADVAGEHTERIAAAIGSMLGGWLLGAAVHRVSTRTGVTDAEAYGPLPGDDLIAHPMVEWTRGITVRATAERVWPWLAQMGYGRGGWYTPQWIDLFANRWVFGHKTPFPPSADRLLSQFEHVAVGTSSVMGRTMPPTFASTRWIHRTLWCTDRSDIHDAAVPSTSTIRSRHRRSRSSCGIPGPTSTSLGRSSFANWHSTNHDFWCGPGPTTRRRLSDCWRCHWDWSTPPTGWQCYAPSPDARRPLILCRTSSADALPDMAGSFLPLWRMRRLSE